MAKKIEGITIKIEGDTTGLAKSLKSVNAQIKDTSTQLKDVQKALKLSPGNTTLLEQQQRLLNDAIEETKEKLELEKQAAEKANAALANGDISQAEYDQLQREIIKTTSELDNLEKQAKEAESAISKSTKKMEVDFEKVGKSMKTAGENMTKYMTTGIVAGGAASVAAFNEVDNGLDIIIKKTGATGDALKEMEDIAKDLASEIPTDFDTVGSAVGEVNTRFKVSGKELEELSKKYVKFAQINDMDVSDAIDTTQKAMTAFNVETKDAGLFLDTLNATGQKYGIAMQTLSELMVTNSASLNEMGFNAAEAAAFLGQCEVSGVDVTQVMTGLSKALKNAAAEGKPLDQALAEIQSSMLNAESETAGLQAAYELFGAKGGAAIYTACKNGSLSFDDLSASMLDNLGNLEKTYDATLDSTDDMKVAMNELKISGSEFGEEIGKAVAPVIKEVASGIRTLAKGFGSLPGPIQRAIIVIAALTAAAGPLLLLFGNILTVIPAIKAAITTGLVPAITSVATVIKGSVIPAITAGLSAIAPFLPVAAAVVAAIAAIIMVIKNWDAIVELFKEIWKGFTDFVKNAWEACKNAVLNAWAALKNGISNVINGIKNTVTSVWSSIKAGVINTVTGIKDGISNTFQNIWDGLKATVGNIKTCIVDGFTDAVNFIKNLPAQAYQWGKDLIENFINGIKSMYKKLTNSIADVASVVKSYVGFSLPEKGPLSDADTYMPDFVDLMVEGINKNIGKLRSAAIRTGETLTEANPVNYSGQLDGIRQSIVAAAGSSAGDIIIPVYIGGNKIDEVIAKANKRLNYRSGGR